MESTEPWEEVETIYEEARLLRLEVERLREALERIKAKGDGTWSADRCAVEAEAILGH